MEVYKPKLGDRVIDKWFKFFGIGECIKASKSKWKIKFYTNPAIIWTYDKAHLKFLEKI